MRASWLWLAVAASIVICGCGKSDESISKKKALEAVVKVELAAELSAAGLSSTTAKRTEVEKSKDKAIAVYFVSSKPLKASLVARALNKDGLEIGRSVVDVDFAQDDAQYVAFLFDEKMETMLVEKCTIGINK